MKSHVLGYDTFLVLSSSTQYDLPVLYRTKISPSAQSTNALSRCLPETSTYALQQNTPRRERSGLSPNIASYCVIFLALLLVGRRFGMWKPYLKRQPICNCFVFRASEPSCFEPYPIMTISAIHLVYFTQMNGDLLFHVLSPGYPTISRNLYYGTPLHNMNETT